MYKVSKNLSKFKSLCCFIQLFSILFSAHLSRLVLENANGFVLVYGDVLCTTDKLIDEI